MESDFLNLGIVSDGDAILSNEGTIEIGPETVLRSRPHPIRFTIRPGAHLSIGRAATLEFGTRIHVSHEVVVGDGVRIGPHVEIDDAQGAQTGLRRVVVGAGASLGAGVRLYAGAVVPPGTRVPAGSVFGGAEGTDRGPEPVGATRVSDRIGRGPSTAGTSVRGVVVADFTAADLASALSTPDGHPMEVDAQAAPFGQIVQTLHTLASSEDRPDFALVWTRPEEAISGFRAVLDGKASDPAKLLEEVDAYAAMIRAHALAARFVFVATWILPPNRRGLGMIDLRSGGVRWTLTQMNQRLVQALSDVSNVFLMDAERWVATGGMVDNAPKLWYLGKIPFGTRTMREAALDIRAAVRGALGMARKLIVLDLDDTLWGGVVGDVGWEALQIGGHDAAGEAYVEFQRRLLAVASRGIALAVVSKNEETVALGAMAKHAEMLIRPSHLAAYRINWQDKAQNIVDIARELNLGLQSIVFIDDNPVERGRIREALPEVLVPDWPDDPTAYPDAFESLRCFDAPAVSREDSARHEMFAAERDRRSEQSRFTSVDDWLASLHIIARFDRLGPDNVTRAAQLLNKTNQMNLRTRRLSESEFLNWSVIPGHEVWTISVSDRFGDSGLTGLLSLSSSGDTAVIEDFVLSCRVMGRGIEQTMLWAAVERARALGKSKLIARPLPTAKNKPCMDFIVRSGLHRTVSDQAEYEWPAGEPLGRSAPVHVDGLLQEHDE